MFAGLGGSSALQWLRQSYNFVLELGPGLSQADMITAIYAESLSNIRHVTISVSLLTPSNAETRLELEDDGQTLHVHHEGATSTIRLPQAISRTASLQIPSHGTKELSLRVLFADEGTLSKESPKKKPFPLSADALARTDGLACQACEALLIDVGRIYEWKDLPQENWAEMMELWHCHKPNVPHDDKDHSSGGKGYAADSRLIARPGVGLVGVSSILVSTEDCSSVKVGLS